ncbi:MAG: menaquinone biosynthesis decarboxylase [Candidatus Delongbacteria bacterium]|nr:menaquinone biosynthesis decarboxylase [Candidatus Delongbacteria bacterium]MBN2836620.1 menaquinone biosynthesis decarboxylase [Candidatus Delongbacteria bacterium]
MKYFENLQEYIKYLRTENEVIEFDSLVSKNLMITEIADRVVKKSGKTLIFNKVVHENGNILDIPLVINLFGTKDKMTKALGVVDLKDIADRITKLLTLKPPTKGLWSKLEMIPQLKELLNFPPKEVKKGRCQEIVYEGEQVNLDILPILKCWPDDAGNFVTLPMVITKDPETGVTNCGMYRMQQFDKNSTGMHWHRHKGGAVHYEKAKKLGKKLEVAVVIGTDPATLYTASAPLPPDIPEFIFSGFLRNKNLEIVKCKTLEIMVPANAEIILEGYVDPQEELRIEGKFGDHTGYYSLEDYYPVFHVTCITTAKKPIYPATIVGIPPMEDFWMGFATERIFLPLLKLNLPEVTDMHMPPEGVFHNLIFLSIKKRYPGQAQKVINAVWGTGLMMLSKVVVVVDDDTDVTNPTEAWWVALNNIDPERDIIFSKGPIDVLDHASREFTFGSKMGIDGTRKWKEEGFHRRWPEKVIMSDDIKKKVDQFFEDNNLKDVL